jgi:hypothetical protein
MPTIDFPTSPTNGQVFTNGDKTWVYSTTVGAWNLQAQTAVGPSGPIGPTGVSIANIDGGFPSTNYGGITSLDSGGV